MPRTQQTGKQDSRPEKERHPLVDVRQIHERDRGKPKAYGAVIDRVIHDVTGRIAEIRLDKGSMDFTCIIGEDRGVSKDGRALKEWALDRLSIIESNEIPEWIGVLQIRTDRSDSFNYSGRRTEIEAGLSFNARRYWIARTPSGQWKRIAWEKGDPKSHAHVAPADRFKIAESFDLAEDVERGESRSGYKRKEGARAFKLPHVEGEETYLAYDEALWQGCKRIASGLVDALSTLRTMLTTATGNDAVRALGTGEGQLLLSAGKGKGEQ